MSFYMSITVLSRSKAYIMHCSNNGAVGSTPTRLVYMYIYIYVCVCVCKVCVCVAPVSRGFATHHPSSNASCYVSSNIKKTANGRDYVGRPVVLL
jgi:hypothetical protein